MTAPTHFVYIAGNVKRDDTKIRAMAGATGMGLYDAKIMIGAPGPRKVGAFVKEEDAQAQAVALRQGGFTAFVIDKNRFSRAPRIIKALKAVETPDPPGLLFTVEAAPAPGEITARVMDLPQPRGIVRGVIVGFYIETKSHGDPRSKTSTTSRSEVRQPFIHLYSEDPHTILEITGPRFECAWLQQLGSVMGEQRWLKLSEMFAGFYAARLDATLFKTPEEAPMITSVLNVDPVHGLSGKGAATASSSADHSPIAIAASRIIVYSLVFGV